MTETAVTVELDRDEWQTVIQCIITTQQEFTINAAESKPYWALYDKIKQQVGEQ